MCRSFISTESATYNASFSVWPEMRSLTSSPSSARPIVRVSSVSRCRLVGVGEVCEGARHAVLMRGGGIAQRTRRRQAVEAGEADVAVGIVDDVAVEVLQRSARIDLWRDVLVAVERVERGVTAG